MSSAPTVSKEYGAHDLDELKSICLTTPFIDAISATSMLVLDYFRVLGLKTAYDAFVKEAAIEDASDDSYLKERSEIMQHVLAGEIRQAVSKLSDVDSTLLRSIGFHMQKQALLEIIRRGQGLPEALKYAQVQVAPLAKDKPEFVAEVESIMTLLLYNQALDAPYAQLLSDEQRTKTAEIANSALLRYAKHSERPKLELIMKAIFWAQDVASNNNIPMTRLLDLRSMTFDTPDDLDNFYLGDGHSDIESPQPEDEDLEEVDTDDQE